MTLLSSPQSGKGSAKHKRWYLLSLVFVLVAISGMSSVRAENWLGDARPKIGTEVSVYLWHEDPAQGREALEAGDGIPGFPDALLSQQLDNTWRDTAHAIVGNWVGLVYQLTHRDRCKPFMDGVDPGDPLDKDIYSLPPEELANVPSAPGSLDEALDALKEDHAFLLKGDVFTQDAIDMWIDYKIENEVNDVKLRPHPHEFFLYYDI